ncbi:MAG: type II toxin-antitoxin system HicB family antitoxin [bacterium]|nr:type II toxin-antitoxin system HicB family antitoxin [bacterium]
MPKVLNYEVIIEKDEDGVYVASVPKIQGCHTEGDTREEALERIKEVIELCLETQNL